LNQPGKFFTPMSESVYFYRRGAAAKEEEIILGKGLLRWAYHSPLGKSLAALLFHHAWPSRLAGWFAASRLSRRRIAPVIRELAIDATEFADPVESYPTFNAFFTRRLKPGARPFSPDDSDIASPADGRVLVYPRLQKNALVPVKGKSFTVDDLLGYPAAEFHDGSLAVIRLCPADYHRFHFPCEGRLIEQRRMKGRYHSVNPLVLALGIDVFSQNERHVTVLENARLARYAYVEVGAFGVGSIVQTYTGPFVQKGDEKGYFQYGSSTVILVFQPGKILFEKDLLTHSAEGYETFLQAGHCLGKTAATL